MRDGERRGGSRSYRRRRRWCAVRTRWVSSAECRFGLATVAGATTVDGRCRRRWTSARPTFGNDTYLTELPLQQAIGHPSPSLGFHEIPFSALPLHRLRRALRCRQLPIKASSCLAHTSGTRFHLYLDDSPPFMSLWLIPLALALNASSRQRPRAWMSSGRETLVSALKI